MQNSSDEGFLRDYQRAAVARMHDGCILNGGTGSGKSRTGLYYYISQYGGSRDPEFVPMTNPPDLYIITTASKRDRLEWEAEMLPFMLSQNPDVNYYSNKVVVDSWNNIKKYIAVEGAFFIFDEDRVTGSGTWAKTFIKIAHHNRWILLSATPGDCWLDFMPVFVANGYYRNMSEFKQEHCIYSYYRNYPKLESYLNVGKLMKLRRYTLVRMNAVKDTVPHHETVIVPFDVAKYRTVMKDRWDPFKEEPIENAPQFCYTLRKVINSDPARLEKVIDILEEHPKAIIFYNYDYELEILKQLSDCGSIGKWDVAEWNGHKHMDIPNSEAWVYLVQYNAGSEGWNCTRTDTIIFYSNNYSYKMMSQAEGRIDRLNTPYRDLYYYHVHSRSGIDLAILDALHKKQQFNENEFYGGC